MTDNSVEARLDRLESIEAIRALRYRYAVACDAHFDRAGMSSVFTADAVWESEGFGRLEGRDAILDAFSDAQAELVLTAHLSMNPLIEVDGDTATAHWWLVMPSVKVIASEDRAHLLLGEYDETYRREAGQWLISNVIFAERHFEPLGTDWSAAWRASAAWRGLD